jgi:hypothetical protein
MPTIKIETSGLYMIDFNMATERLRTATSRSGQLRPRQVMSLFGDGHEDGNHKIHDDALEDKHDDTSCHYQACSGPGYESQYKRNDSSRANGYLRSGGKSFIGGECSAARTNVVLQIVMSTITVV